MILTSLSALQEKLNEIVDQIKTRRKKKRQDMQRKNRSHKAIVPWCSVTINNCLSWKVKFDTRLLEIKKKSVEKEQEEKNHEVGNSNLKQIVIFMHLISSRRRCCKHVEADEASCQEMGDLEQED